MKPLVRLILSHEKSTIWSAIDSRCYTTVRSSLWNIIDVESLSMMKIELKVQFFLSKTPVFSII